MQFDLLVTDGTARRGRITFQRGVIETPAFMPVGTYGSVKAMTPRNLADVGAEIILGNTFHLWLRPGLDVIGERGVIYNLFADRWQLSSDMDVNYMVAAMRKTASTTRAKPAKKTTRKKTTKK